LDRSSSERQEWGGKTHTGFEREERFYFAVAGFCFACGTRWRFVLCCSKKHEHEEKISKRWRDQNFAEDKREIKVERRDLMRVKKKKKVRGKTTQHKTDL
jgi:hypothetical protein